MIIAVRIESVIDNHGFIQHQPRSLGPLIFDPLEPPFAKETTLLHHMGLRAVLIWTDYTNSFREPF